MAVKKSSLKIRSVGRHVNKIVVESKGVNFRAFSAASHSVENEEKTRSSA